MSKAVNISNATIAQDLERAADIMEQDGWCRGTFVTWDGRRCGVGALRKAIGYYALPTNDDKLTDTREYARLNAATRAVTKEINGESTPYDHGISVVTYNDRQRDRRKVIRLFRRTARKLMGATR